MKGKCFVGKGRKGGQNLGSWSMKQGDESQLKKRKGAKDLVRISKKPSSVLEVDLTALMATSSFVG